jgi:hypothetical protein
VKRRDNNLDGPRFAAFHALVAWSENVQVSVLDCFSVIGISSALGESEVAGHKNKKETRMHTSLYDWYDRAGAGR